MNHARYHRLIVIALCFFAVLLSACVERFDVVVVNYRDEPIVVANGQFHSEEFNTTSPKEFSMDLLLGQQEVALAPKERRIITFSSASGGFWLRWRLLSPLPEPNSLFTLDLLHDEKTIAIH